MVKEVIAPRKLVYSFKPANITFETLVMFTLEEVGSATRLTLLHSGWDKLKPEEVALLEKFELGWENQFLHRLKTSLESGDGHSHKNYSCEVAIFAPASKVYAALTTPEGLKGWWTGTCEVRTGVGAKSAFRFSETYNVMLTGAGRGFCSGGDISRDFQYPARYRGHKMEAMLEMRENMHVLIKFLRRFDKPTIAAINGAAVAGGLTLALCCDFRVAGESARLGDTSLRFALIPDEGGAYLFPQFMGLQNALKMSLFSEVYPARQAKELGLVTEVVPDAELMANARAWAERGAAPNNPASVATTTVSGRVMARMLLSRAVGSHTETLEGEAGLTCCDDATGCKPKIAGLGSALRKNQTDLRAFPNLEAPVVF